MYTIIKCAIKGYNGYYISKKDNTEIREDVTRLFKSVFKFKENFYHLPSSPSIIVCHYVYDRFENMASIMIPKNLSIIASRNVINISKLNYIVNNMIPREDYKNSYENIKLDIKKQIEQGNYIFAYITKATHKYTYIGNMRTGLFSIAKELGVPITPIAIDYIDYSYGIIHYQNFHMHVGDTSYVEDVRTSMYNTRIFFKNRLKYFQRNKYIMC